MSEWIDISKEKPKNTQDCLVYLKDRRYCACYYFAETDSFLETVRLQKLNGEVIFWQPQPPRPEGF